MRAICLAAALLSLGSCHTGTAQTATGAIVMTTLAGGASAYKRSTGDCYVDCLPGTRCNRATGLCESLPCRDKCGPNETCEESLGGIKCIPASGLQVSSKKGEEVVPVGSPKAGQPIAPGQTAAPAGALSGPPPKVKNDPTGTQGPAQPSWRTDPNQPDAPPAMENPSLPPPK
ncbi:MAG: hypothetical protein JST92_11475 [Deltaproteobacteria bacterium]|nr:hypothetical protein [Deltaproteobacteria bacterium]